MLSGHESSFYSCSQPSHAAVNNVPGDDTAHWIIDRDTGFVVCADDTAQLRRVYPRRLEILAPSFGDMIAQRWRIVLVSEGVKLDRR